VGCNRNCLAVGWDGCGASRGRHPNLLLEVVGYLSARFEAGRGTVAHRTVIQIRSALVERPPFPMAEWPAGTQQVRHCPREGMSRNTPADPLKPNCSCSAVEGPPGCRQSRRGSLLGRGSRRLSVSPRLSHCSDRDDKR
jgi:hypothetical protein